MEYLIFTIIAIFIAIITYQIIKSNTTRYEYTTLEILKDIRNPLIKNKIVNKELQRFDTISLCRKERFVFGKLEFSELYISKGFYNDYSDDCDY